MVRETAPRYRAIMLTASVLALVSRGGVYRARAATLCSSSQSSSIDFGTEYHVPVLCAEAVSWLITNPAGTYVDGTLGGGGHSAALLQVLAPNGGHLIGVDRDPEALATAGARLAHHLEAGHATLVRSNFGALAGALRTVRGPDAPLLDGMLLDLGVSSHQLNEPSRGFSFMRDGPLDMRMAQTATASGSDSSGYGGVQLEARDAERARRAEPLTAATIVNQWDEKALADVLWKYGEERESRRIARSVVAARPLHSTAELVEVLKTAGTKNYEPKEVRNRLSRVFQALRIEVNQEMAELEAVLLAAARLVRPGGRLAVMSYHSLEDRRVKRLLRSGSFGDGTPPKDAYGNELAPWKPLTRQAVTPSEAELEVNSRARSVRLRVGERTEHEPPPVLK